MLLRLLRVLVQALLMLAPPKKQKAAVQLLPVWLLLLDVTLVQTGVCCRVAAALSGVVVVTAVLDAAAAPAAGAPAAGPGWPSLT